jgi:hypothetical protein
METGRCLGASLLVVAPDAPLRAAIDDLEPSRFEDLAIQTESTPTDLPDRLPDRDAWGTRRGGVDCVCCGTSTDEPLEVLSRCVENERRVPSHRPMAARGRSFPVGIASCESMPGGSSLASASSSPMLRDGLWCGLFVTW